MIKVHRSTRLPWRALLAAMALCAAAATPAHANPNCVGEGDVQLCPPILTNVEGTATSIVVHWLTQGVVPDRVALVADGTLERHFADGRILASESKAGPVGFASYAFTLPAPAGAGFPVLHLLGIWGNQTLASAGFSASTAKVENRAPPVITSSSVQDDVMRITWTAGRNWPRYNVRWERDRLDGNAQQHEAAGGVSSQWSTHAFQHPGTYLWMVQGCDPHVFHSSDCSGWSAPVKLVVATQAPKAVTYGWTHLTSGDCEMKDASVTFRSDGSATFTAQVKTNHTTTHDIWHATLSGETATGQTLFTMGALDGPRMADHHDFYPWTKDFAFDPAFFPRLGKANMRHSC